MNYNPRVIDISEVSKEDWVILRKQGIGGSDVACIVGNSPYAGEYQVWQSKKDPNYVVEENNFMKRGNDLEPLILDKVNESLRNQGIMLDGEILQFHKPTVMFQCDKDGFGMLLANPDGIHATKDQKIILEIKTSQNAGNWTDRGVPQHYIDQVQHYMFITGATKTYVARLSLDEWTYEIFVVNYDPVYATKNAEKCRDWWNTHIVQGVQIDKAYEPQTTYDAMQTGEKLNIEIESADIEAKLKRMHQIKGEIYALEKEDEILKNDLRNFSMNNGHPKKLKAGNYIVNYVSMPPRETLDSKALKAYDPELFARFAKKSAPSLQVRVGEILSPNAMDKQGVFDGDEF